MSNFSSPRSAVAARFPDGVTGKIIVMKIAFCHLIFHGIEGLFHARRTESHAREDLRGTTFEKSGAMGARHEGDRRRERADFIQCSSVGAPPLVQNFSG